MGFAEQPVFSEKSGLSFELCEIRCFHAFQPPVQQELRKAREGKRLTPGEGVIMQQMLKTLIQQPGGIWCMTRCKNLRGKNRLHGICQHPVHCSAAG